MTSIVDQGFPITQAAPKAPRKPRPSEIAAKKAKAAAKKKTAKPKATKPRKAKPPKRPNKPVPVVKKKKGKPAKSKVKAGVIERPERLDMRLSKAEKAKVLKLAKKRGWTITQVVYAAIGKLK